MKSPSVRGRGLKPASFNRHGIHQVSPSVRGRGLKLRLVARNIVGPASPSVRGRGLKPGHADQIQGLYRVALRAGAWIETRTRQGGIPRSCVALRAGAWIETSIGKCITMARTVALRAGAWIETKADMDLVTERLRRPPCGGVD